jgi:hypothetical protein
VAIVVSIEATEPAFEAKMVLAKITMTERTTEESAVVLMVPTEDTRCIMNMKAKLFQKMIIMFKKIEPMMITSEATAEETQMEASEEEEMEATEEEEMANLEVKKLRDKLAMKMLK